MDQDVVAMLVSTGSARWSARAPDGPQARRDCARTCWCASARRMFMLLTAHAVRGFRRQRVDPTRIIHGVITGVGFLGAGSIMRQEGYVHGLTTAASIWMVAAIGAAVGVHAYSLAVIGTVLALVVLEGYPLGRAEADAWRRRPAALRRERAAGLRRHASLLQSPRVTRSPICVVPKPGVGAERRQPLRAQQPGHRVFDARAARGSPR